MGERQTLGDSILFGAADWEAARSEGGVMAGRQEWDTLCKLAARADAAERLALAVGASDLLGMPCAHLGNGRVSVDEGEYRLLHARISVIREALASFRAHPGGR